MKVILHIGASVCGGSSLQRFLSINPILPLKTGGRLIYTTVNKNGEILAGNKVRQLAKLTVSGFVSSAPLGFVTRNAFKLTVPSAKDGDVVVLSSEGWRKEHGRVQTQDALSAFGQVEAVMYVRPQIDYFNNAYWQWGAWEDVALGDWVSARLPEARWHESAQSWAASERVEKLTVRLLPSDIITDFLDQVGVDTSQIEVTDDDKQFGHGLPGSLLRLLQRHRQLRPGPHDSEIDFVLTRYFGQLGNAPPWVLDSEITRFIVDYMRESNVELMKMLTQEQSVLMQEDVRWWKSPPQTNTTSPADVIPADDPDADNMLATAIEHLMKLERHSLHLKSKLADIK